MQISMFRPSHLFGAIAAVVMGVALLSWAPWSAQARGTSAPAVRSSNVAMNCAPGQQALVRQAIVDGELSVSVDCAGASAAPVAYREFGEPLCNQPRQSLPFLPSIGRRRRQFRPTHPPRGARERPRGASSRNATGNAKH